MAQFVIVRTGTMDTDDVLWEADSLGQALDIRGVLRKHYTKDTLSIAEVLDEKNWLIKLIVKLYTRSERSW